MGAYFTGSVFIWGRDAWLGVRELDGDTYAAYEYDSDKMVFDGSFKHSWAASTRNSLFWFKNLSGVNPQFRWTDRTDQDFDDIDDTADTGFVYGPFTLEIEKAQVTGAGSAGPYVIFATKGGTLWSFDSSEVFVPMTPFEDGGFIDQRFGGKLAFVGTWLMVPSLDGLKRFDPRNISMVDISPPVHQGSYASVGTNDSRQTQAVSTSPSGAIVFSPFLGTDPNALYLEMYSDGMFYHEAVSSLDVNRVWGAIVTHAVDGSGNFTSQLRCYFIAMNDAQDSWLVYRLDMPTAGWQPGPETLAATSGLRTTMLSPRSPDVSVQATQVRLNAQGSSENYFTLYLEMDDGEQIKLGDLQSVSLQSSAVPYAFDIPSQVKPGRRLALAFTCTIGNQAGIAPFIAMPIHVDYRYTPQTSKNGGDLITLKVECTSDYISKATGGRFTHGRSEADFLTGLRGKQIEVGFADSNTVWVVTVEDVQADLMKFEDGLRSTDYLATLVCRRTK